LSRLLALIDRRPCLCIAAVLLLAFALRLGWSVTRPSDDASIAQLPDQREYLDLGRSLLSSGTLAMGDARFNDVVRAFRMPGYPAFIAACGGHVTVVRVVQAVLDTSTVLAVIWLARRWLSMRLAILAGLAITLDPLHVYFSGLILSETTFAVLLTWGMACLVHGASPVALASRRPHVTWIVGVILLIASIYIRPSAIAFPLVLAFFAMLAEARSPEFLPGRRLPVLGIVALVTFLALLPWAMRNRGLLGRPIFTTTNDGFTLYDGLNPDATGASDQSWVDQWPLLPNLSEVQRSDYLKGKAIAFAREHPGRVLAMVPAKLARTWSPWPLSREFGSTRNVVISMLHAVPLFVLALVGMWNLSLRRTARLFLLVPAIAITIMHGLTVGSLRYRMPADATLAVLAVAAFSRRALIPSPGMPGEG
jgi:4-amino-4-deoxy-L-arabinose transferase-like glycosyltransferase